jgi:hypothetical protein
LKIVLWQILGADKLIEMSKSKLVICIAFGVWMKSVSARTLLTPLEKKVEAKCISSKGGVFYPTHKGDAFFLLRKGYVSGRPSENVSFVTTSSKCYTLFECALQGAGNTGSSITQIIQTKLQAGQFSYTFFCMERAGNSQKFEVNIDGIQPKVEEGNPFGADGD